MFYGINAPKAVKNIVARKDERAVGKKAHKIKSALIVQGGSMRGIFSAGSLIALERMGFTQGFDAVYGASGGAVNASYFLSGQATFGTSIYYEDMNNSRCINILRFNKIFDIDYLFDDIVEKMKRLDAQKVINSKSKLYFFVTDADCGGYAKITPSDENFLIMLKASCSMPVYCNQSVCVDGKNYFDGAVSMAIPIEEAIRDSCTDILVLLTQSVRSRDSIGKFENLFLKLAMPKLKNFVESYLEDYNRSFDISIGKNKISEKVNISTIVPDDDFRLNRLTKNERLLKSAAIDGAEKTFKLFGSNYDAKDILRYN